MKQLLLVAAVTVMSASAFASKAKVSALGGASHLKDMQTTFKTPTHMNHIGDQLSIEFGHTATTVATATDATPNAEGGFVKAMGNGKLGFYLGRHHDNINASRSVMGMTATTENPFDLMYAVKGDFSWGVGLYYSASDKKTTTTKQSAQVLTGSIETGAWAVEARMPLANTVDDGTTKYTGKGVAFKVSYDLGEGSGAFLDMDGGGAKTETIATSATTGDSSKSITTLGYNNTLVKADGVHAFYEVAYQTSTEKEDVSGYKKDVTQLPVLLGVEAEALPWLTLRASFAQNVFLGSTKTVASSAATSPATDQDSLTHNAVAAAGFGFKWGKNSLDLTAKLATSGDLGTDAANFGAKAGYTYMF